VLEALLSAVSYSCDNLTVIIDANKIQTDQYTENILQMGDTLKIFSAFGFHVHSGLGHTVDQINKAFGKLRNCQAAKIILLSYRKGQE